MRSIWLKLCASHVRRGSPTRWQTCYLIRVDGLIPGSFRFFCCAQVLVLTLAFLVSSLGHSRCGCSFTSCRAALSRCGCSFTSYWSALSRCGCSFTSCRFALLFSSQCLHRPVPVFVSLLVRAATVRHVSRHATLLVRALLLIFDELFAHPRADPRFLLVVRWLRQPAFTFFSWSAGCVTSLHVLRVVRWLRRQPALSPPPRAARGAVAFFGAVAL